MLPETCSPSPVGEAVDQQPSSLFHACLDMAFQDVFPVAEALNLDNTDFSLLEEFCVDEKEHSETIPMANYNSMEGTSAGTRALTADWLSGNLNLDFDSLSDPSFQQSALSNQEFYTINSADITFSALSDSAELLANTSEFESPIQESFLIERSSTEERIYPSCDESKTSMPENNVEPFLLSESDDMFSHDKEETDSCVAGKKYYQMRKKNNLASQRSRKLRKQKNQDMSVKLKKLEAENKELLLLAADLEKQKDTLQSQLLQILSKK